MQAYHEGLYGDNYLWMVFGWYDNNWWEEAGQFNCTSEQLYTVVKGSLAVQHYPVIDDTSRKVIGNIVSKVGTSLCINIRSPEYSETSLFQPSLA